MGQVEKSFMGLLVFGALAAPMTVAAGGAPTRQAAPAAQNDVTAIDILLDPDATMVEHATAANAKLLQSFPHGFTLGGAHAPHITMLQRYVRTAELPKVYAAVDGVFAKENPTSWKLTAYKYAYTGSAKMGGEMVSVGNILVKTTPDLLRLQQELIDAVKPFEAATGTAAAYVTTPQDPDIVPELIPYVAEFVPAHSGDHYVPHVSIGVGTTELMNTMAAAPFDDFTFSPVGASVYHLGNYGTAAEKLHAIPVKK
jgi:hypothetical protein